MKIDLTNEEWEFFKKNLILNMAALENFGHYADAYKFRRFLEKLGNEWVDDEFIPEITNNHV